MINVLVCVFYKINIEMNRNDIFFDRFIDMSNNIFKYL